MWGCRSHINTATLINYIRLLSPPSSHGKRYVAAFPKCETPNSDLKKHVLNKDQINPTLHNHHPSAHLHLAPINRHQMSDSVDQTKDGYARAISDLNSLQSGSRVVALSKYDDPRQILPLFRKQITLAGLDVEGLNKLNVVHISGTKGKGSTCAYIESILRSAGLKTGFYNSPHLISVTERIKLDGQPISEKLFSKYFKDVYDKLQENSDKEGVPMPSYFSFLTILAFHVFLEERVDCAIIEVGIGGEYDPTNVIERPVACGITTLDFDHTNILGKTMEDIAHAKSGISKSGVPLFVIEQDSDGPMTVIKKRADQVGAKVYVCKPFPDDCGLNLGIRGSAQYYNASLACHVANYFIGARKSSRPEFEISPQDLPDSFRRGLENCSWPGRCQIYPHGKMIFYLDGAHTKKSMENCLEWYSKTTSSIGANARRILMVNIIGERDRSEILRPLSCDHNFELVIFSPNRILPTDDAVQSDKFYKIQQVDKSSYSVQGNVKAWEDLGGLSRIKTVDSTKEGFKLIQDRSKNNPDDEYHILVTGSLHFVGAILETIKMHEEITC